VTREIDWSAFLDLDARVPGVVVGVVSPDALVVGSFGAKHPGGPPLDEATPLYVGSLAKQFTAACIANLVLTDALSLDDDVHRWLPELPRYAEPVRLAHLLSHTSGLPSGHDTDAAWGFTATASFTTAAKVQRIATLAPTRGPGVMHEYSGYGYVLLAEIVARAAGMPLGEYAERTLFGPLRMTQTGFLDYAPPEYVDGWVDGLTPQRVGFTCVGDGGLITTLGDLAIWTRWLPDSPVGALMLSDRPVLPDGTVAHDAWGVSLRTHHGVPIHSHGGAFPGCLASLVRFPTLGHSLIVMANTDRGGVSAFNECIHRFLDAWLAEYLDFSQPPR
jgi:CubicO group peptidase (beta-lactamase class C family)